MPFTYDYAEPERLLSAIRLSSYQISVQPNNKAELFGAYSWNLAVIGAFYPLIQIIEVALRNSLHNAAKEKIACTPSKEWFDCILDKTEQTDGQANTRKQVKQFKDQIRKAKKLAKKTLEDKGIESPIPTADQVVAKTDFVTWELLLDKGFYDGSNNAFLWPHGLTKAFKKLPRYADQNAMFHQRDIVRRRIEEVRSFRNRISHNEPAWRPCPGRSKEDIINELMQKLDNMMELLFWISPKFRDYVRDIGLEARLKQILNITDLYRYMHRLAEYDVNDLSDLSALIDLANTDNIRCHFKANGETGILLPNNTRLAQY